MDKTRAKEILDAVDEFGLKNWVQVSQFVSVVRWLVESLPEESEEIHIPSSAIVSGPIKVASVEIVQPVPFDMGLDDDELDTEEEETAHR